MAREYPQDCYWFDAQDKCCGHRGAVEYYPCPPYQGRKCSNWTSSDGVMVDGKKCIVDENIRQYIITLEDALEKANT